MQCNTDFAETGSVFSLGGPSPCYAGLESSDVCGVVYLTVSTVRPSRLQCKSLFLGGFAQGYNIKWDLNGNLACQFGNIFLLGTDLGGGRGEEKI